jgi:lipopolysaccharide export system protein LptC
VRKWRWVLLIALLAVAIGVLFYGIHQGDAQFVLDNAAAFCFT